MKLAVIALLTMMFTLPASLQAAEPPASGKYWVFLGTYTAKNGSQGIYRSVLDHATGELSEPELAANLTSPSFLAFSPNGKNLYAVGETGGPDGGGVFAFSIDATSGALTKIAETTSGGGSPCHVVVNPKGDSLLVSNYSGGNWKIFRLNADGTFSGQGRLTQLKGKGPNKQRQEGSHAHCGAFSADGSQLFVVDLGTDSVWPTQYTATENGHELIPLPAIRFPAGSGPRHIDLTSANDWAFVCGELDSTVNVMKMNIAEKKFDVIQSLSTLPGGKPVPGNSTAEVRIHPTGQFVYVSNRGHNSIATFKWDGEKLSSVGHATEGIKVPRNFNIEPTGKWMLVASQEGNNVAVFSINSDTGLPIPTGKKVAVGKPVCVKFLAKP